MQWTDLINESALRDLSLLPILVNLVLVLVLGQILCFHYLRYSGALSNKRKFAPILLFIAATTMLVISIVKTSLALSLGLVGALSIIRFRTPIKEPEELAYLFLAIALGLGFGANQWRVTIVAFLFVALLIMAKARMSGRDQHQNLYLTVSSRVPGTFGLEDVVGVLSDHCSAVNVTRFDETGEALEASFLVDVESFEKLNAMKSALRKLNESMSISFLESKGVA